MATTVDTLLVRIEADMADLKRDLAKVSQTTERHTDRMADAFRKVGRAIAVIGGTAIFGSFIKSAIDTGSQVEALKVQLDALLGSAEQGGKAFDIMAKFAGRVPFSLAEIQAGSGSLAAASNDADELGELLQVTGNIAAQFGIPFNEAAANVQRAMSAGIGAADLFRDKGVSAFAGFEAGVSYSSSETVKKLLENFGTGGKADGAMDAFAQTTAGTVSMFGDAMHRFRTSIAESGLNEGFRDFINSLTAATNSSMNLAEVIGNVLGKSFQFLSRAVDAVMIVLSPLVDVFRSLLSTMSVVASVFYEAFGDQIQTLILAFNTIFSLVVTNFKNIIVAVGVYKSLKFAASLTSSAWSALQLARSLNAVAVAQRIVNTVVKRGLGFWIAIGVLFGSILGLTDNLAAEIETLGEKVIAMLPKELKDELGDLTVEFEKFMAAATDAKSILFGLEPTPLISEDINSSEGEIRRAAERIQEALAAGASGGGKKTLSELQKTINANIGPIHKLKEEFILLSGAMKVAGENAGPKLKEAFANVKAELEALQVEMLEKTYPALTSIRDGFNAMADSLTDALVDAVEKGKLNLESLRDTFRDILRQMIADAIKAQIIRPMISGMFSAVGGAIGGDAGTFISSIGQTKSATGGPVMRGAPVLVGERGPELFVPQGAGSIVNAATTRGMGGGVTVNQTFAFSANGDESVKKIIHQAAPQIAKMTEQGIMGSRRRGGQMKAVFG